MPYSPKAKTNDNPTFTWSAVPGAAYYTFYLSQYAVCAYKNKTPAQVDPNNTGTCSYTPANDQIAVNNGPWPVPLAHGHTAAWWLEAFDAAGRLISTSGELTIYVPNQMGPPPTDFNVDYIDAFDPIPVTREYYVSDFIGQSRRVIDTSQGSGTNNLGYKVFQEGLWTPVDISDLLIAVGDVNLTARMARLSMQIISSCTNGDMIGWTTRRNGTQIQNIPAAPLRYVVAPRGDLRAMAEFTVLLNNGKFDFLWSHIVNGIDYAAVNGSVVTGRALNASVVSIGLP